jgi:protoporphyrinogen oxidase
MQQSCPKESIAVVGGGISGIAAAIALAKSGCFDVTIFEREHKLGGLSSFYKWQNVICDRFYHVILPSDHHLLEFVKELGLNAKLFWQKTKSGFYGQKKLVSFSSSLDFVRFPFLSLWQKFRLAAGILFSVMIKNPRKIDGILAQDWLVKVFGRKVYANFWDPLLWSKFGAAKNRISSTFIWATINRLYGARSSSRKQEKMGQVRGGYQTILNEAEKRLSELKVKIITGAAVNMARFDGKLPGERLANEIVFLLTEAGEFRFNKVLFTVPSPLVIRILGDPDDQDYWQKLRRTEYLRVICVLLILGRKLSSYYLINLLDQELPFTGIIESTNIFAPKDMDNKHLVYLPRYMTQDDPLYDFSDVQIVQLFLGGLRKVFPDLRNEDILHAKIFRENYVQPLMELSSAGHGSSYRTPWPNLFLANTSFIRGSTLNNNTAVQIAQEAAKTIIANNKSD